MQDHVLLEQILCEASNEALADRLQTVLWHQPAPIITPAKIRVAPGATRCGVPGEAYNAYRQGLTSACADTVIVALRDGVPKALLIERAKAPFGNCWWIQGGAIFNFRPIAQFLLWKAHKECGLLNLSIDEFVEQQHLSDCARSCGGFHIIGALGTYRTPAEDTVDPQQVCDTINTCYMTVYDGPDELSFDSDHRNVRWVSAAELENLDCGHWYPRLVATRALLIYEMGAR